MVKRDTEGFVAATKDNKGGCLKKKQKLLNGLFQIVFQHPHSPVYADVSSKF